MFFVRTIAAGLLLFMPVMTVAQAEAEAQGKVAEAVEAVDAFHQAYTVVVANYLNMSTEFNNLFSGRDDYMAFANASYALWNALPNYQEQAARVRALLGGGSAPEYLQFISSEERVAQIDAVAKAAKTVTDSTRRFPVSVSSTVGWQQSGVKVSGGDFILVKADGHWTTRKNEYPPTDWQGYSGWTRAEDSGGRFPLGALLFRSNNLKSVSSSSALEESGFGAVLRDGEVEFTINDENREDNEGTIALEVYTFDREALNALRAIL